MRIFILLLAALGVAEAPLRAQVPTITTQPASQTVWAGANVTFTVAVSGVGPFTYQWLLDSVSLPTNIITTFAGGGVGDGGAATNANLWNATGIAVDSAGNVFIADSQSNRIRKVDTNGVITTVVGNGSNVSAQSAVGTRGAPFSQEANLPYPGDGGPATNASLSRPTDVVLDPAGNLFIADSSNNRIRKVDTNGIITTVAGNGTGGYDGDGGAAVNASLNRPTGVAIDAAGNLFVADNNNNVVRRIGTNGIITTVAGTNGYGFSGDGGAATNAGLSGPYSVAVDTQGNLFIADSGSQRIRKVGTNGIISTAVGTGNYGFSGDGGAATNAQLWSPSGLAFDSAGNLLIADESNSRIRKLSTNGIITTVAGTNISGFFGDGSAATNAALNNPQDAMVDASGNLYIADSFNYRIRKVSINGIIATIAGNGTPFYSGDGGPATSAGLGNLGGITKDNNGNVFIADIGAARVRKIGTNGIITTFAGTTNSSSLGDGGAATNASLNYAVDVATDTAGNVFIADELNYRIRKVGINGIITTMAGTNISGFAGDGGAATNAVLGGPSGVAVDAIGNVFIADAGNQRIRRVDTNGIITTVAGNGAKGPFLIGTYSGDGGLATNAGLSNPSAVTVDSAGNLYIADSFNYRVRKVGTNGIINTYAGNGIRAFAGDGLAATNASMGLVYGVSMDSSGNLLIADNSNNRIRKVATNGIISTVAGNGTAAFAGDGGAATSASLNGPYDVAPDSSGNLFITDSASQRIRKVTFTQPGPVLSLTNVTDANAGNYQVVVTGAGGSVTSSPAIFNVVTSPLIYQTLRNINGSLVLNFVSRPGSTNVVFGATNLSPPVVWQPLSTNFATANGDWQFTDSNTVPYRARFYRSFTPSKP